jgi:hypothetical protein
MRQWFTSAILVVAMLGGATGAGVHAGESSCPMSNLPDCCKKAKSATGTPEVAMARLCCNLNCSETGSSATNVSSSVSPHLVNTPDPPGLTHVGPVSDLFLTRWQAQWSGSHDSKPKYIQHLALLI